MNVIVEEAVDEAVGGRSKRWAFLLLVLLIGGVIAVVLARRSNSATLEEASTLEESIDAGAVPD